MILLPMFNNKLVGLLGLGGSGIATARALRESGAKIICWDDAVEKDFTLPLTAPVDPAWDAIAALVVSPGIPLGGENVHPLIASAKAAGVEIIGDVELFARAIGSTAPVIAVTGTNGKSTTAALIAHILNFSGLRAQLGGNIGKPVLELDPPERKSVYVLEVSSFQLDTAPSLAASIAVQTNVAPDHTERYGSLDDYAASKAALFTRQQSTASAIIGVDDDYGAQLARYLRGQGRDVAPVSIKSKASGGVFALDGALHDAMTGNRDTIIGGFPAPLARKYNWQNASCAYAVARKMKVRRTVIMRAMANFRPLPHRMELVAQTPNMRFFNDSKATNAAAALATLQSAKTVYWIAGGRAKPEGFDALIQSIAGLDIKKAYLIGEGAKDLREAVKPHMPVEIHASLAQAVHAAARDASSEENANVILAPACASYDQFANFAERGEAFRRAALQWLAKPDAGKGGGRTIVIAAGGTGGHFLPAQALSVQLRQRGYSPVLFTDRRAFGLVDPSLWDDIYPSYSAPVAGGGLGGLIKSIWPVARGIWHARQAMKHLHPVAVIGFGGYVSVPPVLAARSMRIPVGIHQQGRIMGRANRLLTRFARFVACAFPNTENVPRKHRKKLVTTGMPLRESILDMPAPPYDPPREGETFRLLVFGGSQGARFFAQALPETLARLPAELRCRTALTLQCRDVDVDVMEEKLARTGLYSVQLASFYHDMEARIARAHLVIARAGAGTVSELIAQGRPAIFIPITGASGREQAANSKIMVEAGAGWLTWENGLNAKKLADRIASLAASPRLLAEASAATADLQRVVHCDSATTRLADLLEHFIKPPRRAAPIHGEISAVSERAAA